MGKTTKESQVALMSLDIGNGFTKGVSNAVMNGVSYPSVTSVVNETLNGFQTPFSAARDFVIGYRGRRYGIGESAYIVGAIPVTMTHRSRLETDHYRVLFASALAALVPDDADVRCVLSLPPSAYFDREKQRSTLSGVYEVDVPMANDSFRKVTYTVDAQNLRIVPEGLGSICALVLNPDGSEKKGSFYHKTTVGVVDVGTYTTDLIMLDKLRIVRSGTDSMQHALFDVYERLKEFASSNGYDLDMARADEVLHRGYILRQGRRVDISQALAEWQAELTSAIGGMIRSKWNGGDDVEAIIVTGGGAPLVAGLLAFEFAHVQIIDGVEPFFANAAGAYRYLLLREFADKKKGRA